VRIRFQADADVDPDIGRGLLRRQPSLDWRPAQGLIPDGTPDSEVLRVAARDGRVLVSCDVRTIMGHFTTFVAQQSSPGVILIPSLLSVGEAIERLLLSWSSWSAEELENQIRWLNR
jgi:hypothetical protein